MEFKVKKNLLIIVLMIILFVFGYLFTKSLIFSGFIMLFGIIVLK